ncbi:MAG: nucleotidyltransferase domain-containing protein [Acutalibacteraceae bacterium]
MADIDRLISALASLNTTGAVVIGGSRAYGVNDNLSDYDIYVYSDVKPDQNTDTERGKIIEPLCSYAEIGNEYWEHEDNVVLKDGTHADIIYRQFDMVEHLMDLQLNKGFAFNNYTTCFWFNLLHTKIMYDRDGKYKSLQEKANVPYPEILRKNIITRSKALIFEKLPAFDAQIEKAYARNDIISVNHRTAEFLASYSDMIFALNRLPHLGEKRILAYAVKNCKILPKDFAENITELLSDFSDKEKTLNAMHKIVNNLKDLLTELNEM